MSNRPKTYNDPLADYCRKRVAERAANPEKYVLSDWEMAMKERYRQSAARLGYGY